VPVEVIQFGWEIHGPFVKSLGADPVLRVGPDGEPMVTDNGNYILDCHFRGGIDDPRSLDLALGARAGVVETGFFLGLATEVLVSSPAGVKTLSKGDVTGDHSPRQETHAP
jgi:ribose 5-phosphate isomerase A